MFNISEGIAALRDAETIASSKSLTVAEKGQLLGELLGTIPPAFNRPYITTIYDALERLHGTFVPAAARPTEGKQDATPVASGPRSPAAEAPKGPTEGKPEQAQDAGVVAVSRGSGGASATPAAPSEKPKASQARK